jgi:hypothetical protein
MSEIILPTKKTAPTAVSPENLMIFSKPKVGKTSLLAALDDCLLLDLESGSKYIEAMRMEATDIAGIKAIGEAIKAQNNPYKYVAIDTVTKLEDLCIPYAEQLYSNLHLQKLLITSQHGLLQLYF